MPAIGSGAHGLKLEAGLTLIVLVDRLGEIPGVVIEEVAGRNGPGIGYLACVGDDQGVAWKAPGSTQFGVPVVAPTAYGSHVLEDGVDASKWVRVTIYRDYRTAGSVVRVYLKDRYENEIGHDGVTSAEAASGDVSSWTITLHNRSAVTFHQLKVWIDPAVTGLEISDDGATWVSPTTEETALVLPDLVKWADDTLHVRRTIAAGASADPLVLNHLHFAFMRA